MKSIVFILLPNLFLFSNTDPQAKTILDKVQKQYHKMGTLEIFFNYELTSQDKTSNKNQGQLLSKEDQFKLMLPDMEIYSNGKTQYTYLKKNKEVQITSPDEKENKYHPKYLAEIYNSGRYHFSIIKKIKESGKNITIIEFIPNDKADPIRSIQLFIFEKTNLIGKVQWIEDKGDKTTVTFTKTAVNNLIPNTAFELDVKNLKGVHVEDLRDE